ncbi:endonuclease domain-containing protein [Microbacterium oleivorans]|uniref:DUF559 domain-containing protein n=1 Tax=Microbacterium oleivorans TaxID=273677 RepID=A0A7D5EZE6_9MICO|nr:DUF559 domain-containing protein [Microbacterium oleivorans]QLD12348.1 DUF559 domain-containing protein [Microbacterium oleivorans]
MPRRPASSDVTAWVDAAGGIAHRSAVLAAGFPVGVLRESVAGGELRMVRRAWCVSGAAPGDLLAAASAGGRLTCVSLARRRGWWMPDGIPAQHHVHLVPHASTTGLDAATATHWTRPLCPVARTDLEAGIEDALGHIAQCLSWNDALVVWESAARVEALAPETLQAVPWTSVAARELASAVTGLADSGLETILFAPLRERGLPVVQQAKIAGRFVDALVGDRLVLQVDGFAFHSSSAQRTADVAHDAELRLRGYTVLRFTYRQLVHERAGVEWTLQRALAQRLHLRP